MLILADKLTNAPVMSLQTGAELARISTAIINPAKLTIVAYKVQGARLEADDMYLLTSDVREISSIGLIIDSNEELVHKKDMITLKNVLALHFNLIGMDVIDDLKQKLGKIYNYAIDPLTFTIHQLNVKRPLLKSLQTSELVIGREQIIEINDKAVVVKSATIKQPLPAAATNKLVNPFRSTSTPQPDASSTKEL